MGHEQELGGASHLLLFPFLAQGHMIPFLNLAKRIEDLEQPRRRPKITIVSTPRNVASLRLAVPTGSSIGFAELPFSPSDHGLPADAESTDVIPLLDYPAFFFATETASLQTAFEKLVSGLAAREKVCVVADVFLGWTAESARKLGVQHRLFVTGGAYASAITFSIWLRQPTFPRPVNPDDEQAVTDFPDVRLRYEQFLNVAFTEDVSNPMTQFLRRTLNLHFHHSGGVVVNTAQEIEKKGLDMIGRLSGGLPAFAVGPLIGGRAPTTDGDDIFCIEFLDSKPAASVLYVSFGSQNTIPASQMMELARGLEASGRPFIWMVRPPVEFDGAAEFRADEWLPDGFEARVTAAGRQGVVVRRWAPQLAILAHASTGAFLSHCGWNSVLESLWHGVPVLGWPLLSDQPFDSRLLVELGVGVEVASGRVAGGLPLDKGWEHVRDVVEAVLGDGDEARHMRAKAAELKKLARAAVSADGHVKGSSVLAMERLLDGAFR
ncbi:hypothetical protein EJB05_17003, partial [Eragrostis curvula]